MSKQKVIIVFTVLVDVIGLGIIIPILPFYVSEFGASPLVITLLFSVFSFFAFLSNPLLGALSDKVGRRPIMLVSLFSTALGWFVFAAAQSIPMLFLGRIIDGAAAGNFSTSQSYIVDIARDEKERTTNLGLVGATFGAGLMIGPLIGGVLSTISHSFPFWFAGGLAFVNGTAAYFFLPESHRQRDAEAPISYNPLRPLIRAFSESHDPGLRPLYLTWLLFGTAFFLSQSVFALYVENVFQFDAFSTALLFAGMGIIVTLNQGVFLNVLWTKYVGASLLARCMITLMLIGISFMATPLLPLFLIGLAFMATGQSIFRIVLTSQVVGHAKPMKKGETIGNLGSIMAASMALAPALAGFLFELNPHFPYIAASIVVLTAFPPVYRHVKNGNHGDLEKLENNSHIQKE